MKSDSSLGRGRGTPEEGEDYDEVPDYAVVKRLPSPTKPQTQPQPPGTLAALPDAAL